MKVAFYSNDPGNWKFIYPISTRLESFGYACQIHMNWEFDDEADILWFDFCNSNLIAASNENKDYLSKKKVIARIHAAEFYLDFHNQIDWSTVDHLIFVSEHFKRLTVETAKRPLPENIHVIHNGIDLDKLTYHERHQGKVIGYAGNIVPSKGIIPMLHYFKDLLDMDGSYRLKMAGLNRFGGREGEYYQRYKVKLGDRISEEPETGSIDAWLEGVDYLWQPSFSESFSLIIGEAMAKGIKPIINDFNGAKELWPAELVYDGFEEFYRIVKGPYESAEYRNFVLRYSLDNQIAKINDILK